MRELVTITPVEIVPDGADVLRSQGIPASATVEPRVEELLRAAIARMLELARPTAILEDVAPESFATVYRGDGHNADRTPLEEIYPRAERLVLFAATVGDRLSDAIQALFDEGDLAAAVMLDAVASEAVERLVAVLEDRLRRDSARAVLAYSPGYCGWHVSGQRALFDVLVPEEIGITLNRSFLMQPLKSVSGVLVEGRREIHEFDDDFSFCSECATRDCRVRIARVREV